MRVLLRYLFHDFPLIIGFCGEAEEAEHLHGQEMGKAGENRPVYRRCLRAASQAGREAGAAWRGEDEEGDHRPMYVSPIQKSMISFFPLSSPCESCFSPTSDSPLEHLPCIDRSILSCLPICCPYKRSCSFSTSPQKAMRWGHTPNMHGDGCKPLFKTPLKPTPNLFGRQQRGG